MRYPGTIIVEILEPIPAGLARGEFRAELQGRIEAASNRLIWRRRARRIRRRSRAEVLAHAEAPALAKQKNLR